MIKQLANKVNVMGTHNTMLETHISLVVQQQETTVDPAKIFLSYHNRTQRDMLTL